MYTAKNKTKKDIRAYTLAGGRGGGVGKQKTCPIWLITLFEGNCHWEGVMGWGWYLMMLEKNTLTVCKDLNIIYIYICAVSFILWTNQKCFQFSSVIQSCPTLSDPMDCSTPGFRELAQTRVHRIGDAIQSSHPLLSPSPPAFNLAQHQGLFQWVSS